MSGRPYPEGVSEVIKILNDLDVVGTRISQLSTQINTANTELTILREKANKNEEKLNKLLSGMDLISTGNYGHENRRNWFLLELIRQMKVQECEVKINDCCQD